MKIISPEFAGRIYSASISRRLKYICFGPRYIIRPVWTDSVCRPIAKMVAAKLCLDAGLMQE